MEYVDDSGKADRIDGSESIALEIIDDFQHGAAAKSLQRLCRDRLLAALGLMQRVSHASTHGRRKFSEILSAGADENARLWHGRFDPYIGEYGGISILCQCEASPHFLVFRPGCR